MTMPVERTRALRQAGELLRALNWRPDIPEDIRRWAEGVLRHYPEHSFCQGWLLSLNPNSLNDRCDLEQTVERTTRGFSER